MPVSEQTYLRVALEDPEGKWELYCGELRSKPAMTTGHNRIAWLLGFRVQQQLDFEQYEVRVDAGRARRSESHYFIPDVIVVPAAMVVGKIVETPQALEAYAEPLPLIVEVWSPSTGSYDVEDKLPEYQRRGDLEIWLLHPYERHLSVWQRQSDGSYTLTEVYGGMITPSALPGVSINLDELFDLAHP